MKYKHIIEALVNGEAIQIRFQDLSPLPYGKTERPWNEWKDITDFQKICWWATMNFVTTELRVKPKAIEEYRWVAFDKHPKGTLFAHYAEKPINCKSIQLKYTIQDDVIVKVEIVS